MSEPGPDRFGAFIERTRRSQRWSQHQFGEKVGVRSSYVTSVENGENWPTDHFIEQCAALFGVPHEYLYAMLGQKPAAKESKQKPAD